MQQISQTSHGQKILKKLDDKDDIKTRDADKIVVPEVNELQKELQQANLKVQEMEVDYLERAKRIEEIPLLVAHLKKRELQDEDFWKQEEQRIITERELAVDHQNRLFHMKSDKIVFLEKLLKDRSIVYEDKLKGFENLLAGERKKRLAERRKLRIEEKRANYIKEKQKLEKKVNDMERAKRIEEISLLVARLKVRELQDEAYWKKEQQRHQSRLPHMKLENIVFLEKLLKDRSIVNEDKLKEFEKLLAGERKKRLADRKNCLAERKKLRIKKKRANYITEKQELEEQVDDMECAKRIEEISLLVAQLKVRELQDEAFWKKEQQRHQSRLLHMKLENIVFLEKLLKDRSIVSEDKLKEFEKFLAGEDKKRLADRKKCLAERKNLSIEEKRANYIKEQQELEKMVDYLERAKRIEEIPLLVAHLKERELQDEAFWKQEEQRIITERELAVGHQNRLLHMKPENIVFLEKLLKDRSIAYEELLADGRKKRLAERRKLRIEERRNNFIREKQEDEKSMKAENVIPEVVN